MAHEIAHVACRHATRQQTKGDLMEIGAIAGSMLTGWTWTGYAIRQGMSLAIPLTMLQFTRAEERQADHFGLQYLYKSGYDPKSFVDFFEKIETMEKRKPGSIAKVFLTHPMNDDRIKSAQQEIQTELKPKDEYVVNTSEFNDVKGRLAMLHNRHKVDSKDDPNRPRLRRAPGTGTGPVDDGSGSSTSTTDDSDRPTLKRRPDSSQQP